MKRFLMYFTTYVLITFATAFGVVLISDPTKATNTTTTVGQTSQHTESEASSPLTYIVDNFTTMDGMKLDTTVDLTVDGKPIKILADVTLDLTDGFTSAKAGGTLTVFVNNNPVNLDFSYVDGMLYFGVFNGSYKISTNNLISTINQVLTMLNVEMPDLSSMGLDLNNLDITSLLSMFDDIKETKSDTYTTLSLYIPYVTNVDIKCDLNYNIQEISLPKTKFENFTFKVNVKTSYPDDCTVSAPNNNPIDLTHVFNLAQGLANFVTSNNQIGLNVDVLYNNINLAGDLSLDLNSGNVGFKTEIENNQLNVYLINNVVYVEFENILIKADFTRLDEITTLLNNQFGISLPIKEIAATMVAANQIDLSQINLNLENFNPNQIDLGILENFTYENGVYLVTIKDTCVVTFKFDSGEFKNIKFVGFGAEAKIESVTPFEIKPNHSPEDYVDVYDVVPVLNSLINTLKLKHHTGTISFEINEQTINANYELYINDGLTLNLNANVLGLPLNVTLENQKVYLTLSEINIVSDLSELKNLLPLVTEYVKATQPKLDASVITDTLEKMLSGTKLLVTNFEQSETGLNVELLNKLNLTVTHDQLISKIETTYEDVKVTATINSDNLDSNITIDKEKFVEVKNVVELFKNIISYVNGGNYYFNTTISAYGYNLTGFVGIENALTTPNLQAEFNGIVLDRQISLKIVNQVVYLELDGLNLKFNLNDYDKVIKFVETNFGVNTALVVNELVNTISTTTVPLPNNLSGLNLKLTNNCFEAKFDQANVTMDVTNNKLNSIILSYDQFNLKLDVDKKHEITLGESYIDVVTLLPFIESTLNTLEAGKLEGVLTLILNNEELQVNFKTEFNPSTQVWLQTTYKGLNIDVNLHNNQIFIKVNDLYLKAGLNDLDKITEFLNTTFNISLTETDLTNLVNAIDVNQMLNNFSLSAFNNIAITNNTLKVNAFNTNVYFEFNTYINNIEIEVNNIYASVKLNKFANDVYMPTINTDAYDTIDYVLGAVKNVYDGVQSKNYMVNGTITLNQFELPINLQVLATDTLTAKFATTIYDKAIELVLIDKTIYATLDGFKIKYNLENVDDLITLIETTFNLNISELTNELINTNKIDVNKTVESLSVKTISKTNLLDGYNLTLVVLVDSQPVTLVATFNSANKLVNLGVNYSQLSANLNVAFGEIESIDVNTTEYVTDLEYLTTLINPINNLINAEQIELSGLVKFDILGDEQTITLKSLKLDYSNLNNLNAILEAKFLGFDITLAYIDGTIYVGADNLKTYIAVNEIEDLISWINTTFNQNITLPESSDFDINELLDVIKEITLGEIITSITRTPNGIMVNLPSYYNSQNVANSQEIVISYLNDEFTNIIVNHQMVYAEINFVAYGNNVSSITFSETEKSEFVHYTELTALAQTVEEFVVGKQYSAHANALVYNGETLRYDVNLGIKIDVTENLKLDGFAQVSGEQNVEFDLDYWNKYLFINYDGLKLKICEADVKGLIAVVLNLFGVDPSLIPFLEDAANDLNSVNFDSITNLLPSIDFGNPISLLTLVSDLNYSNGELNVTIDGSRISENPNAKEMHFTLSTSNNKLTELSLTNIYTGVSKNEYFNLSLNFDDFTEIEGISETEQATYHDLSGSIELIKAVINTSELKYYHITATVHVEGELLGFIPITWNIPLDIQIKVEENGAPTIAMVLGEIPTIGLVNKGTFESVKKRMFYLYYKDSFVYLNRTETNDGDDYKLQLKLHINDVLADPLYVLQFGTGFTDDIMEAIYDSLNKSKGHTPNPGEVLNYYKVKDNVNFELQLNMEEITNDPLMGDMTIGIGVVNNEQTNNKNYVGKATFGLHMPLANNLFELDLSSNNLALVDVGKELDFTNAYNFINNYAFNEGEEYEIVNGSAKLASTKQYTITFEENGGTEKSDITAVKDAPITLPTYTELRQVVNEAAGTRTYYRFEGWYTNPDFISTTKFTDTTMPRGGAVLYANWVVDHVEAIVTITFNSNGGSAVTSISEIAGVWIDLTYRVPTKDTTYVDKGYNWVNSHAGTWTYEVTTYTFAGWYIDSSLTTPFDGYVPNTNSTLYAKWTSVTTTEYYYNWERP